MARPASINDHDLILKLSSVFRDVGYDGASLAALSDATGLKRASLYHRFPDGKEQMAREVLIFTKKWLSKEILTPLKSDASPESRIQGMIKTLNKFYSGGRQACLLNMLSSSKIQQGPFTQLIKGTLEIWIKTLAGVLEDAGFSSDKASMRSQRAVALLQGSLVLSRGMGSTKPFKEFLNNLPAELLGGEK